MNSGYDKYLRHDALFDECLQKELHDVGGINGHPIEAKVSFPRKSGIKVTVSGHVKREEERGCAREYT